MRNKWLNKSKFIKLVKKLYTGGGVARRVDLKDVLLVVYISFK